ncbi:hypothetical protein [Cesiribacter sp. SM1]|uniref:hypothetical protein n=1 Tax=Cesiribacter sp. SM1 TaxID=2861196 RepID=UPI001CD313A2|nr:hypothetical protein [Cesiribacter sp. SM1]
MRANFYLVGVLALLAITSCDDDDAKPASAPIMFDGKGYTAQKGFAFDFGPDLAETHYNYDFALVDQANVTLDDLEDADEIEAKFLLYAELFSPGSDEFRTGTFTYDAQATDVEGDYYFNQLSLVVDSNNDGKLSDSDNEYLPQSGTVTVSGSANNYTLSLDLTMAGGKKLTGSYSGNFQYFDFGGERAPDGDLRKTNTSKLILK